MFMEQYLPYVFILSFPVWMICAILNSDKYHQLKEAVWVNHGKKMVAPVIIAAVVVLYYIGIALLFMTVSGIPLIARTLMIVIPLLLSAVMIGVLVSRIREIKGGEEDDLSQY